ncbi:serine/threonine-protein kinase [Nonomuraea sp. NPDC050556]|uniref:serine/threonine-protein kinase n=1 Tax=Nonomuraea sp. NPDC050556 TaxID=3364369 RepID=UPI0037B52703
MQPLAPSDPRHIDDFRLSGVLGRGGQGSVYLAEDPTGGKVAVKVLHTSFAGQPAALRRFTQEADTARRVAPFCTARVLAVGVADDRPYIASEFVSGPCLAQLVREQGPRSGNGLERLAVTTLTALAAIHRAGIVHRDFKPTNVIMGPEGPVVIDFGIARAVEMTATSSVMGTPAFMAPEQFAGTAGAAADLFSWASTMIYAATGQQPFRADTMPAMMHAILTHEPDLAGVPDGLRGLVAGCLAKDPAVRPSADELLAALTGQSAPATAWPGPPRTLMMPDAAATPAHAGQQMAPPVFNGPGSGPHGAAPPAPYGAGPYVLNGLGTAPQVARRRPPSLALAIATLPIAGILAFTLFMSPGISVVAMFLLIPVIGVAVRGYNLGAMITSFMTLPLGGVFLLWAALGSDEDPPLVLMPYGSAMLLGAVIAGTALLAWRANLVTGVLGAIGGFLFTVSMTLALIDELTDTSGSAFKTALLVVTILSRVLIIVWLLVLSILLIRSAARRAPATS